MPSVIDIAGKTRAEEPPLHPTSRRAALEIARENIHTVQVTSRPGPKTYTMHGPGYYTEECNVLRNNRKKTRANGLTRNTAKEDNKREDGL